MSNLNPLIPQQPVPALAVDTTGGQRWSIADSAPEKFTLVVFYRGLHCPICKMYLNDLQSKIDDFAQRGVDVIAISSDTRERAEQTKADWGLDKLTIGYGLGLQTARSWGLYISAGLGVSGAGIEEPALFSEPGIFIVRPSGDLFFAATQTMPFARPHFAELVKGLDYVIAKNYPGRGEVQSLPAAAQ